MDQRQVQRLYGKLFMGPFLTPHYYVKFADSSDPEFVQCTKVSLTTAQRTEFDSFFRDEENHLPSSAGGSANHSQKVQVKPGYGQSMEDMEDFPGEKGQFTWTSKDYAQKGTYKAGGSKARARKALNFLDMESAVVRVKHGDISSASASITPLLKKVKKEPKSPGFESDYDEDLDSYDASFIDDGTPRVYSSSSKKGSTPGSSKKGSTPGSGKIKRKRVLLDSDDEVFSVSVKKGKNSQARKRGYLSSSDENEEPDKPKPVVEVITLSP